MPVQCDEEDEDPSGYNVFISRIMASETVRDANKYTCSECSRNNEAQLTVSYEQLPSVLVLHLNRFAATASRSYVSKLTDYMPTPLVMDCFCQKCRDSPGAPLHRYRLYSVILHLGKFAFIFYLIIIHLILAMLHWFNFFSARLVAIFEFQSRFCTLKTLGEEET